VTATDKDLGSSADITYSLAGRNDIQFWYCLEGLVYDYTFHVINISIKQPIDKLFHHFVEKNITISSKHINKQTINQSVSQSFHLWVLCNYAVNEDSFIFVYFYFSGDDGRFVIGAKTGEIRTSSIPLNREIKPYYTLRVTATDPGNLKVHMHLIFTLNFTEHKKGART